MDFAQILNDVTLWIVIQNNQPYLLGLFNDLAVLRWDWLSENLEQFGWNPAEADRFPEATVSIFQDIETHKKNGSNPMKNKKKFFQYQPLLLSVPVDSMNPLSQKELEVVQTRVRDISELTESDFREMYAFLQKEIRKATKYVNLHSDSNKSKNPTIRSHIFSDIEQINAAMELEEVIEQIIYDLKTSSEVEPNLIKNAISNLEGDSEAQIRNTYLSAVAVPFEDSLEKMADKYLGSAERWLELTAVNKLQPPYVDKQGKNIRLTSNPDGKSIQIPKQSCGKIKPGQKICIYSARDKKKQPVLVQSVQDDEGTLTLELNQDVSKYKKRDLAAIKVYEPNTVQEDSFILIPSTEPIVVEDREYTSQQIQSLDRTLRAFGTDFEIDDDTDDWIIEDNDTKAVYGIPAVKQAISELLKTTATDNKWHRQYGISATIGTRYLGFDQATNLAMGIRDAVRRDGRYSKVVVTNIAVSGTSITINLTVWLPGNSAGIPLSFIS